MKTDKKVEREYRNEEEPESTHEPRWKESIKTRVKKKAKNDQRSAAELRSSGRQCVPKRNFPKRSCSVLRRSQASRAHVIPNSHHHYAPVLFLVFSALSFTRLPSFLSGNLTHGRLNWNHGISAGYLAEERGFWQVSASLSIGACPVIVFHCSSWYLTSWIYSIGSTSWFTIVLGFASLLSRLVALSLHWLQGFPPNCRLRKILEDPESHYQSTRIHDKFSSLSRHSALNRHEVDHGNQDIESYTFGMSLSYALSPIRLKLLS